MVKKLWTNANDEARYDDFGNQLSPPQKEAAVWREVYLKNGEGYYDAPYCVYLPEGDTLITLVTPVGGAYLGGVTLAYAAPAPDYEAYARMRAGLDAPADTEDIRIQGEDAFTRSDSYIVPIYDNSDAMTEPSDAYHIVRNTIGGEKWTAPTESLTWRFNVERAGNYNLYIRARQNLKRGIVSTRRIYIDGEVPFAQADNVMFPFSPSWYVKPLSAGDEILKVYLSEGEHTITLEVSSPYPELMRGMQGYIFRLNAFYRGVIMITGATPDRYTDYEIHKKLPDYRETVEGLIKDGEALMESMIDYGFARGGEQQILDTLLTQLRSFAKEYETVPYRMQLFVNNVSALAAWTGSLSNQPLEIDYLQFSSPLREIDFSGGGIFRGIAYGAQRFGSSFVNDYSKLGKDDDSEQAIDVWVGLGRDQAEVVKALVDDLFVPEYGVRVNVNLVQQGLVPATLTGNGPDVALFVSPNDVVNLAARGALVDLSAYEGFDAVAQRFHANSMSLYGYMDGVYALPMNESFLMMFYRTDIFGELGLTPPDTWSEFYDCVTVLQRNNLSIGIPGSADMASTGGEMMFQTLLFQHGGDYYKDGWKQTGFDTAEALAAFTQWTDFYVKYSLPATYDFYSRFRSGEMPLGITVYNTYNLLYVAAPEIRGLWRMTAIPAYERADGTLDRSVTGAGSGAVMFENTRNKDGAFAFLDWWTSAEIQSLYARDIEALMGPAARYDTANVEAFKQLPWKSDVQKLLLSQWDGIKMVKQTPVNYYISRNIINAYRAVVINYDDPRETLNKYNREMNAEIDRRRREFGLDAEVSK